MAETRMMHDWDQTALIWATLANAHRDAKKKPRPFCPSEVHPMRTAKDYKPKPIEADISVLKALLTQHQGKNNGRR